MNIDKIERFRQQLLNLRNAISNEYEKAVETSCEEFGAGVPDMNDEASRTMSRRILLEIGDKSHEVLLQINTALERMEEDEYGACELCGEDIQEKRLELLPHTPHCVECQEKLEQETITKD